MFPWFQCPLPRPEHRVHSLMKSGGFPPEASPSKPKIDTAQTTDAGTSANALVLTVVGLAKTRVIYQATGIVPTASGAAPYTLRDSSNEDLINPQLRCATRVLRREGPIWGAQLPLFGGHAFGVAAVHEGAQPRRFPRVFPDAQPDNHLVFYSSSLQSLRAAHATCIFLLR